MRWTYFDDDGDFAGDCEYPMRHLKRIIGEIAGEQRAMGVTERLNSVGRLTGSDVGTGANAANPRLVGVRHVYVETETFDFTEAGFGQIFEP